MEAFLDLLQLDSDSRYRIHQISYSFSQELIRKFKSGRLPANLRGSLPVICIHLAFIKEKKSISFPQDIAIKHSMLARKCYLQTLYFAQNLLNVESDVCIRDLTKAFKCVSCSVEVDKFINDYKKSILSSMSPNKRKLTRFGDDLLLAAFFVVAKKKGFNVRVQKLLQIGRVDKERFQSRCSELSRMFPERHSSNLGVENVKKRLRKSPFTKENKENSMIMKQSKTSSPESFLLRRRSFRKYLRGHVQRLSL